MAILPLVLLACLTPTDWSVDPAGGGDFLSLNAALAAPQVLDGDRLWIAPGEYGQVLVKKSVDLLALPGQRFFIDLLLIQEAGSLTVQGLTTRFLYVTDCPGRVEFLDVEVGRDAVFPEDPLVPMVYGKTVVANCEQVLIAGSLLRGTRQCYPLHSSPENCLAASNSRITIAGCTLLGGDDLGVGGDFWVCNAHYGSPPTITASHCDLTFSSVLVKGPLSQWPTLASALYLDGGSLDARGSGAELWTAGQAGSPVIGGDAQGTLSGIQLSPAGQPAWLSTPSVPLPLLRASALGPSGVTYTIELFAPLGEPAAVMLSAFPSLDLTSLPALGAIWFDLSAPFALYLEIGAGSSQPAPETFTVPALPALRGMALTLQAFLPPCVTPACPWAGQGALTPPLAVLVQ